MPPEDRCQSKLLDVYAALVPTWDREARKVRDAAAAISERVAAQEPLANGESVLRRFLAEVRAGAPDYSRIKEPLAGLLKQHLTEAQGELARRGELKTVAFAGVSPAGADVYDCDFANGAMQWRLLTDAEGDVLSASFTAR